MALTTMTFKVNDVDEYERDRFNEFCAAAGIDASTAVRMFVKAVLRENRIPFEVSGDPFFNPTNQAHILKSMRELREGKGTVHELIEVEDE